MSKYFITQSNTIRKIENKKVYIFDKEEKTWNESLYTVNELKKVGKKLNRIDILLYNLEGIENDKN